MMQEFVHQRSLTFFGEDNSMVEIRCDSDLFFLFVSRSLSQNSKETMLNVIESSVFSPATLWPFDTVHIDMFSKCHWPNDRTPSNQPVQNLDQKKTKKTHTHDQADMSCYSRTLLAIGVSMNRLKNVNPLLMAYSCGVLKQAYQSTINAVWTLAPCSLDALTSEQAEFLQPLRISTMKTWASNIFPKSLVPTGTKLSGLIRGS